MEFLLTIIVIFIFIGWLLTRIFPLLFAWYLKRKMKKGGSSFGSFGPFYGGFYGNPNTDRAKEYEDVGRSKEQEGKVTVVTVQEQEKVIEKDMGEYVDFEEEKL